MSTLLNISVKDIIKINENLIIDYNEVELYRKDLITIPNLMSYFSEKHISFQESIRLDIFTKTQQNEIGLIFLKYYGYIIQRNGIIYLNESMFLKIIKESEYLIDSFNRAKSLSKNPILNGIEYNIFRTDDIHILLLYWFKYINRNHKSIKKDIIKTNYLYDINLNSGHYNKIVNKTEFLLTMFDRFIRIQKDQIPFSNGFGSTIKTMINSKFSSFTQKIIEEDVIEFLNSLNNSYADDTFELIELNVKESHTVAIKLTVYITISIDSSEIIQFKLE